MLRCNWYFCFALFFLTRPAFAASWEELLAQASSLSRAGAVDSAVTLAETALQEVQSSGDVDATAVLAVLDSLGFLEQQRHNYAQAEDYGRRRMAVAQSAFGDESLEAGQSYHLLGILLGQMGRYAEADSLYQRGLDVRQKQLGLTHPAVASSHVSLGVSASQQGRYAEAVEHLEQAKSIYGQSSGVEGDLAATWHFLGAAYLALGRIPEAEGAWRTARALQEKLHGPDHPLVAAALGNLGILWSAEGNVAAAESAYVRAVHIYRQAGPDYAISQAYAQRALGILYQQEGRYGEAERELQQVFETDSLIFGLRHPDVALDFNNLGVLYTFSARYEAAERSLLRAVALAEELLGPRHPDLASCLNSLAYLHRVQRRWEDARTVERRAYEIRRDNFRDGFAVLAEETALSFSTFMRSEAGTYLALLLDAGDTSYPTLGEMASVILSTKGQVTDGMLVRHKLYLSVTDPRLRQLVDSLNGVRSRLASLIAPGTAAADPERYRALMASALSEKERLEGELARSSVGFRRQQEQWELTADQIVPALPPKSALVEYLRYDHFLDNSEREPRYLALVITSAGSVHVFPLGPATPIDEAVARYRTFLQHSELTGASDYRRVGHALYDLVWKPLEAAVGWTDLVFIAPDGLLNLISFASLCDDHGRYLIETNCLHYLSSGRDVLRWNDPTPSARGLVAFADPDFDASAKARRKNRGLAVTSLETTERSLLQVRIPRGIPSSSLTVPRLPATRHEAELIAAEWRRRGDEPVEVFVDVDASEENFKLHAAQHRVIHVATHGYAASADSASLASGEASMSEHPLLYCGLLLAGANRHGRDVDTTRDEDGFLTAEEVASLDLSGTELVVLSACATGAGALQAGEGVYGLRRAFQMAGSRTVISSLWPVPDEATANLMGRLYSTSEESIPEIMRALSLQHIGLQRRRNEPDNPVGWAAFVSVGDWRSHGEKSVSTPR